MLRDCYKRYTRYGGIQATSRDGPLYLPSGATRHLPTPWGGQGRLGRGHVRPHRVEAAVHVQQLARGHVQVIGEQRDDGAADRGAVLQLPAQGSSQSPHLFEIRETPDSTGGQRPQRTRADSVDANFVAT